MMADTKIEWAEKVWNPVSGCNKVSAGCKNCYAEVYAKRFWGERKFTDIEWHPNRLEQPLHWKKPARIFVNSMSDLFHGEIPYRFIDKVMEVIKNTPQHTYVVLTKRADLMVTYMRSFVDVIMDGKPFENLWLGVSLECQQTADERIPILLQTPAVVRFISAEPLLGPIYFEPDKLKMLNWVICGGESGKKARPCNPEWVRSLRNKCAKENVPFFFKQWGEWLPLSQLNNLVYSSMIDKVPAKHFEDLFIREYDEWFYPIGKKKAGRLLDGIEHNNYPTVQFFSK